MIKENPDVVICSAECVNLLPKDASPDVIEWQSWLQPWFDEYVKPTGVYDVPKTIKDEFISVVWNKLYKTSKSLQLSGGVGYSDTVFFLYIKQ
jgi:hypothetical protein